MDGREAVALLVKAPQLHNSGTEWAVQSLALVAGVASIEQDAFIAIGPSITTYASAGSYGRYMRFQCDQDFTIAWGLTGMAAPVIGTEWPYPSGQIHDLWIDVIQDRYFRVISANAATFFWYLG